MAEARAAKRAATERAREALTGTRTRIRGKRPAGESLTAPGRGDGRPGLAPRARPAADAASSCTAVATAPTPA
eukprot:8277195-Alexandrium_andersonii.AAC.1